MKIKKKILLSISALILPLLFLSGCSDNKTEVNVYSTSDMHSHFPDSLKNYLSKIDRDNSILIDCGDMTDIQTQDDGQWASGIKEYGYLTEFNGRVVEKVSEPSVGLPPIGKNMVDEKYDMATLGNHEFYSTPEKFKELIDSFNKAGLPLMSANTFYTKEFAKTKTDQRISDPYLIKNIHTDNGDIKIGIIPVTTNTINHEEPFKDGKVVLDENVYIQNDPNFKGKVYMTDIVEESIKISKELKEKENPDMIILAAHTGEQPKKPRHSGNRIQELAKKVPNIDLIVAGHTHTFIDEHEYQGPNGKKVIVTQPGNHAKGIAKTTVNFEKKNDKWAVSSLTSKAEKFKSNKNDVEDDAFVADTPEKMKKINFQEIDKAQYLKMKKDNPNILLDTVVVSDKKIDFPKDLDIEIKNEYHTPKDNQYLYYIYSKDYDTAKKVMETYDMYTKESKLENKEVR
ncbi:MAG: metallophosphoesterase [Peptostreptococcus sp.]|uniref:metallophosphoesterase n=1 Tax=Peptostreptococcus sp. TaxID=1262 RepID=UPI002FCC3F12